MKNLRKKFRSKIVSSQNWCYLILGGWLSGLQPPQSLSSEAETEDTYVDYRATHVQGGGDNPQYQKFGLNLFQAKSGVVSFWVGDLKNLVLIYFRPNWVLSHWGGGGERRGGTNKEPNKLVRRRDYIKVVLKYYA